MPNLRGWEIFVLIAIVVLLFGSKKLPDAARGIGRSLRIFKAETKGLMDDDKPDEVTAAGQQPAALPESAAAGAPPVTTAAPQPAPQPQAVEAEPQSQTPTPPGRSTA